jgi:hypothetical protein
MVHGRGVGTNKPGDARQGKDLRDRGAGGKGAAERACDEKNEAGAKAPASFWVMASGGVNQMIR